MMKAREEEERRKRAEDEKRKAKEDQKREEEDRQKREEKMRLEEEKKKAAAHSERIIRYVSLICTVLYLLLSRLKSMLTCQF